MVLFAIIELTVSSVGAYNIIKGLYNMYCDAEVIKEDYRNHQEITRQYKQAQQNGNPSLLTETQYRRMEGQFELIG